MLRFCFIECLLSILRSVDAIVSEHLQDSTTDSQVDLVIIDEQDVKWALLS